MSAKYKVVLWSALCVCFAAQAQQVLPFPTAVTETAVPRGVQAYDQERNGELPPGLKRNRERMSPRLLALLHRQQLSRSRALAARSGTRTSDLSPQVFKSQDSMTTIVTTIAGVTRTAYGNGGAAAAAYLAYPEGVAVDAAGNVYIADGSNYQVRKITAATGVISAVAGTSQSGYTGDGQLAVNAQIGYLGGVTVDTAGNLYIADQDFSVIRKVDGVTGIISTIAGDGGYGYSGDGGAATLASLSGPASVAVDAAGNLYIADSNNYAVREVSAATGIITTVAGTTNGYGYTGDGGAATQAQIGYVQGLAVDAAGNLYIADADDSVIRVVAAGTGIINTYAGNGSYVASGDGGLAINAGLGYVQGISFDGQGNLYITDVDSDTIRKVDGSTKIITTVAGNGTYGFAGDGGSATQAELAYPYGVAVDAYGSLYIADEGNNRVRRVNSSGIISSVAGNGLTGPTDNGALADTVPLSYPQGIAVDANGNVFFADVDNSLIREVRAADGTLATVVGTGQNGYTGDGGLAVNAELSYPRGIAFDQQGDLYIADLDNEVVRRVDHASGIITTVAGNGMYGFGNTGDGGAATSASLSSPSGIAVDSTGNLYIAEESYPGYVRRVTPQGIISTVAGSGQTSSSNGDGGAAINAFLGDLSAIAVDAEGNFYIGDSTNRTVREVSASTGIISTVAGNGQYGDSGDGGPALNASLGYVQALSFDAAGDLYIADDSTIRTVDTSGIIETVAGQGGYGYSGDGSAVASAEVSPVGVVVDSASNIYFADSTGERIRKISTGTPQAAADAPVLSPGTGGYSASQTVTLTDDTPGAQIFYTLDGSAPDPGTSSLYSGPLSLVGSVTVQAIAIAPGYSTSSGASADYTFPSAPAAAPFAPAFTPAAGAYTTAQSVSILDATPGATIYYTVDGSTPTASSYVYSGAITVNASDTVRAIAVANGLSSPVSSSSYVITSPSATTLASNANPGFFGANIVFTATVTSGVAGTPTGTVSFSVDGGGAIVEVLNGAAQARYPVSTLGIGTHTIVASYSGDASFPPSSSGTLSETIQPGYQFVSATPCRVVDTRGAVGTFGAPELGAGATREFDIPHSGCGIPSTAVAYSLNVTVLPNTTLNYLTMWPSGTAQPNVSTLNSFDGRVKANAAIVPAGLNGGVSIYTSDASNVILDINGYFVPTGASSALAFYPLTPCRVADTRGASGPLGGPFLTGQTSRAFPVQSSACGIPATAQAYSLNLTTIPHSTLNYLTTWPSGQAQPNVSTLNAPTGAVTANAAIVPAGTSGAVSLFVSDSADVILDINGYFAPAGTGGLSLYPVTPCRLLDTRGASGAFLGVLQTAVETSVCALPAAAQAYVLNATVVPPGPLNYLTLWPDTEGQPNVSTLNANDAAVTSNMAIVPTINGDIDAFSSDPSQLILDISSYFAP